MATSRLIFHLGMPKTGTSLLQNSVVRLLQATPNIPLIYPDYGRYGRIAHHALADEIRVKPEAEIPGIAGRLSAEITAAQALSSDGAAILCSSESFSNLCGLSVAARLHTFLVAFPRDFAVEAIIILRELSDFLESMYLQSARFGNVKDDFPGYLKSRRKWAVDFFSGLDFLKDRLGRKLTVSVAGAGFDIIEHFSLQLGLQDEPLRAFSEGVPSTAKRSLKEQVALTHLPLLEAELGFAIARPQLLRLFNSGFSFEKDVHQFTLYDPPALAELDKLYEEVALTPGYAPYAELLGIRRPQTKPPYRLDYNVLEFKDLVDLSSQRQRIAAET